MKKILVVAVFLLFLVYGASAQVQYQMELDEEEVFKNTTVVLECSNNCPGLTWTLSEDETVLGVRDGAGEIDEYEVTGSELRVPGRRFSRQDERVVQVRTHIDREAEEIHDGLHRRTLQLSGFRGKENSGTIHTPHLLSGRVGFGFEASYVSGEMRFQGEGPVNTRLMFGEGYDTPYFTFFGGEPVDDTGMAYEIPVGVTGLVQDFERFPVALHTDESYDSNLNDWSSGEYVSGSIQVRNEESLEDRFLPVLAHEVVHGLNDRKLAWDRTGSAYFDEGTARYVEFLVEKKLYREGETDAPPRELFGKEVTWTGVERGQRYRYTLPPRGEPGDLWNYYQNDQEFMKNWNPSSNSEVRSFGYAYSELLVRNYLSRMNGSLRELYTEIEVDSVVESPETKWSIYSEHLDMTPCDYRTREKFDQCLEEINDYDYPVYSAEPERHGQQLEIEELEIPERTVRERPPVSQVSSGEVTFTEFLEGFLNYVFMELDYLFRALTASV